VPNVLKIGSGVPEREDPEKWHFPLKAFIALTTVLRYCADCDAATVTAPVSVLDGIKHGLDPCLKEHRSC